MPRRRVLTDEQFEGLLTLPTAEAELVRHYTLSRADLAAIERRRRDHNRLGFALQLCALRYPGRLLRPGELIPSVVLRFVGEQLGIEGDALAGYAVRFQTRYAHSSTLQEIFGYRPLEGLARREVQAWLLPVALTTTSGLALAEALTCELRRRRVIVPGPSVVERMIATAMLEVERRVAVQLTDGLSSTQAAGLDGLLEAHPESPHLSMLSWARRPPGAVGHRSLIRVIAQLDQLRAIGIDPARAGRVHPERLRHLAREGARLTAQHLRALSLTRRRAILVATVLETTIRLTDDAISLFDRLIGKLFRRAEAHEASTFQRDARGINAKVRLFTRLGEALLAARETGSDPLDAVAAAIGWDRLKESVEEAKRLARPDGPDYLALAARGYPIIRKVGPLFLEAFELRAVPAAAGVVRAAETIRAFYRAPRGPWPRDAPSSFVKKAWRVAVFTADGTDRRAYELCLFAMLRERLRAGDVWVEGSRQYRAIEDQLIARPLFEAMRAVGPLPLAVPPDAKTYLEAKRVLLEQRLAEVATKAAHDRLQDVRIKGGSLKIAPLKAVTPEEAETLAERLYSMLPNIRITELLAEVDRWTSFTSAFTHLRSGFPAEDRRVVLTAIRADGTNLGLTRMAEACSVASRRQLVWTAGWHLREETYRQALAILVNAQQRQPLAAFFGSGAISSSDGQHFPVGGPGEAVGAVNARYGREPVVSLYTHISSRYAPFHAKLLPAAAGEAPHVVDGLLYHNADLDIAVHHTDGGGVSDHVFALCHLLGFRFAPRIPNLNDRRVNPSPFYVLPSG
jgi:TnpA family transposase